MTQGIVLHGALTSACLSLVRSVGDVVHDPTTKTSKHEILTPRNSESLPDERRTAQLRRPRRKPNLRCLPDGDA